MIVWKKITQGEERDECRGEGRKEGGRKNEAWEQKDKEGERKKGQEGVNKDRNV